PLSREGTIRGLHAARSRPALRVEWDRAESRADLEADARRAHDRGVLQLAAPPREDRDGTRAPPEGARTVRSRGEAGARPLLPLHGRDPEEHRGEEAEGPARLQEPGRKPRRAGGRALEEGGTGRTGRGRREARGGRRVRDAEGRRARPLRAHEARGGR